MHWCTPECLWCTVCKYLQKNKLQILPQNYVAKILPKKYVAKKQGWQVGQKVVVIVEVVPDISSSLKKFARKGKFKNTLTFRDFNKTSFFAKFYFWFEYHSTIQLNLTLGSLLRSKCGSTPVDRKRKDQYYSQNLSCSFPNHIYSWVHFNWNTLYNMLH